MKINKQLPLIPSLPCAATPRTRFDVTDGFKAGDMLHFDVPLVGYPAGAAVPLLGFCLCKDVDETPYCLRAYVAARPGAGCSIPFALREATQRPDAIQEEVFFDKLLPMYLSEIDITDYAHVLSLSRSQGAKVIPMYPQRSTSRLRVAA